MTDIKRLNYFNYQFLTEADFNDEQRYHRDMRLRHNQSLHTWGVASGLEVIKTGDKQVTVNAGLALDKEGLEIVLLGPTTLDLSGFAPGDVVHFMISHQEIQDEADHYTSGGVDNYTRVTEHAKLEASKSAPAPDGAVIVLAAVKLDPSGNVPGAVDTTTRRSASSLIAPSTDMTLADLRVTGTGSFPGTVSVGAMSPGAFKLGVAGNTKLNGALDVTGNTRMNGTLTVTGVVELNNELKWNNGGGYLKDDQGGAIEIGNSKGSGTTPYIDFHYGKGAEQDYNVRLVNRADGVLSILAAGVVPKVGIGALTPQQSLSVAGGLNVDQDNANAGAVNPGITFGSSSGEGLASKRTAGGNQYGLDLYTASQPRLSITNGGYVGIGTITPKHRLHVAGDLVLGNDINNQKFIVHTRTGAGGDLLQITSDDASGNWEWGKGLTFIRATGHVGIGTTGPTDRLDVAGGLRILTGSNPIRFTSAWSSFPDQAGITNQAEISNDTVNYKTLMIVGNRAAGLGRRVSVWDRLEIHGILAVDDDILVGHAGAMSFGNQTRQMIHLWSNDYGIGVQSATQYYRSGGNFAWFLGGKHDDDTLNPGQGGKRLMALNSDGNLAIVGNGFKPGGGAWASSSDRSLKQNVQPMQGVLDKLLKLRGINFEWKEPEKQGNLTGTQTGLVAQEVEEVFPEWVGTGPDGLKFLAIRGFEALTVEAFRDLKTEVDRLRSANQALEKRVKALETKLKPQ